MSENRYRIGRGRWAVVNYDGEVYPERWATEDDAWNYGVAGKYLLTGSHVLDTAATCSLPACGCDGRRHAM